jgi:hypothetical protein
MFQLLDVAVAFLIVILMTIFSPMVVINAQVYDADSTQRLTNVLQQAVDQAAKTANATGAVPGMLDDDGTTVTINGTIVTVYPGRPVSQPTLNTPTFLFLSSVVHDDATPATALQTTIFIAPNGTLQMQDGWTNGTPMTATDTCEHSTLLIGSHYTLTLDCITGTIANSLGTITHA